MLIILVSLSNLSLRRKGAATVHIVIDGGRGIAMYPLNKAIYGAEVGRRMNCFGKLPLLKRRHSIVLAVTFRESVIRPQAREIRA